MIDRHEPPRDSSGPPRGRLDRFGSPGGRWTAFLAGIAVCGLVVVLLGAVTPAGPMPMTERDVRTAVDRALASHMPGPALSQLVYDAIRPSIVFVKTDRFDAEQAPAQGIGSAVVVTTEGDVLTALHVVQGSRSIELTYADGSTSGATVALERPDRDVAVLRPDRPPTFAIPATLGNPDSLRIGAEAFIVGHPYGLVGSLSSGVISGLERTFRRPESDQVLGELIQFDAAVNPGSSGGPLLDRRGHVTGIVTALLNPTEDGVFIGIGLAVPIDVAAGAAGLPPH